MGWKHLAYKELQPYLLKGDIEHCINRTCEELNKYPNSPFQVVMSLKFTNNPKKVAEYLDRFIRREQKYFTIKAIYTETNGFDINPDLWYFELFAYDKYGGHEDIDWVSYWQSEPYSAKVLTGMEDLQEVYKRRKKLEKDIDTRISIRYASLLVVLKFQELIRQAVSFSKKLSCPILATSHDYDFIYEFNP